MKSNIARRIDDTDDPRLPHPMFPRSDGQQESRRIFYIRLFRKQTPNGPIEICPLRFLASESREEGWTHFVKRFGGGYYRAEATSSANKKQAYTGGSSLRWFHFAGPSKPFPSLDEARQAAREAMPVSQEAIGHEALSPTWNEVRALIKGERRFLAEQLEAERKAGDERLKAWMEHTAKSESARIEAERMRIEAEGERMRAMEEMLRGERERARQMEEMLITSLKDEERRARWRENATQQAAARAVEMARVQSENEASRLAYEHWEPVKIPRARKPRAKKPAAAKPLSRGVGRPRKSPREDTRAQAARAHKDINANAQGPEASGVGRALNWIADHGSELAEGARRFQSVFHRRPLRNESSKGAEGAKASATQAREATVTLNAEANASASDSVVAANAAPMSEVQETPNTSPEVDHGLPDWPNAPAWIHKYLKRSEEPAEPESAKTMDAVVDAPTPHEEPRGDASEQAHAEHAPTQAEHLTPNASAEGEEIPARWAHLPDWVVQSMLRTRAREQAEMQASEPCETSAEPSADTAQHNQEASKEETPPTQDAPSICVQRFPPRTDPEGMSTIRTLHGWVTIPSDWLKPDASPAQLASLSRLLSERP